jgi:hypothetical protein
MKCWVGCKKSWAEARRRSEPWLRPCDSPAVTIAFRWKRLALLFLKRETLFFFPAIAGKPETRLHPHHQGGRHNERRQHQSESDPIGNFL